MSRRKPYVHPEDLRVGVLDGALNAAIQVIRTAIGNPKIRRRSQLAEDFEQHVQTHLATELDNIRKHGHRGDDPQYDPDQPEGKPQPHEPKRTLHTISFVYDDNGQHYNEGAMLTKAEAHRLRVLLESRESRKIITDLYVGEDANPVTFAEAWKSLRDNTALQWEEQ